MRDCAVVRVEISLGDAVHIVGGDRGNAVRWRNSSRQSPKADARLSACAMRVLFSTGVAPRPRRLRTLPCRSRQA